MFSFFYYFVSYPGMVHFIQVTILYDNLSFMVSGIRCFMLFIINWTNINKFIVEFVVQIYFFVSWNIMYVWWCNFLFFLMILYLFSHLVFKLVTWAGVHMNYPAINLHPIYYYFLTFFVFTCSIFQSKTVVMWIEEPYLIMV